MIHTFLLFLFIFLGGGGGGGNDNFTDSLFEFKFCNSILHEKWAQFSFRRSPNYEWGSYCCWTSTQQFFSYIMARTSCFCWNDDDVRFVLEQQVSWIFIVLDHWNSSPWVDMSLHSDILFWFWANQSLLLLLNAAYLVEKQQIQIL